MTNTTKHSFFLGANADAYGCAQCPSLRGDLCAFTGCLIPVITLQSCPRTRQRALVRRQKIERPDRGAFPHYGRNS